MINKLNFLDEKEQWAGLSSLARDTATRGINGNPNQSDLVVGQFIIQGYYH
ncbi:MAG: hypothetical protein WD052_05140 [Bacteroidales bacterium]